MTKLIPFLKNLRIAKVKKWVYEERRSGSRTRRLLQKCLIKLVQNWTQSFSDIGSDNAFTTLLHYTLKSTPRSLGCSSFCINILLYFLSKRLLNFPKKYQLMFYIQLLIIITNKYKKFILSSS
jgi:hypothetical protein